MDPDRLRSFTLFCDDHCRLEIFRSVDFHSDNRNVQRSTKRDLLRLAQFRSSEFSFRLVSLQTTDVCRSRSHGSRSIVNVKIRSVRLMDLK